MSRTVQLQHQKFVPSNGPICRVAQKSALNVSQHFVSSDVALLDVLRKHDGLTVGDLAQLMSVTATAVRQRLSRLLAQGYVERKASRADRGRPFHKYRLTDSGRQKAGANFADLAIALWDEVRAIRDAEVRKGLLARISRRLAEQYGASVEGGSIGERMEAVKRVFAEREIPFEVTQSADLPVLTALACPYPGLAEADRSVCAMERMMLSELAGANLRLTSCRLDGGTCCTFEPQTTKTLEFAGETAAVNDARQHDESNPPGGDFVAVSG